MKESDKKQSPEKCNNSDTNEKNNVKSISDDIEKSKKESFKKSKESEEKQSPEKLGKSDEDQKVIKNADKSPKHHDKISEKDYNPSKNNYHPIQDAFWDHNKP